MQNPFDIRTLTFVITIILICRAAVLAYVWTITREFRPVAYWAIGSILMAVGALSSGLRGVTPMTLGALLDPLLLNSGWMLLTAGTVIAAQRQPPWRTALAIQAASLGAIHWFAVVAPDLPLRIAAANLPPIVFGGYAAVAALRFRGPRLARTFRILAVLLLMITASTAIRVTHAFEPGAQSMFEPHWEIIQFYLAAVISSVVGTVLFVLLAVQNLQEKLVVSEQRLAEAHQIARLGNWDWDLGNDSVRWSEEAARLYVADDTATRSSFETFKRSLHPDDSGYVLAALEATLAHDAPYDIEHRVVSPSQGVRHVHARCRVFRDGDGKAIRMVGTVQDITDRKLLEEELRRQARIDFLTGVNNRGHFVEQAERELHRAIRHGTPLALIMMDVDHFKRINDVHGHEAGDAVLRRLAQVCRQTLREIDVIGRLGGEEFAVLLPDTAPDAALAVAERLRGAIGDTQVALAAGGLPLRVTVSLGVSCHHSTDDNIDVLLSLADKALYEAKQAGRDRVRVTGRCAVVGVADGGASPPEPGDASR